MALPSYSRALYTEHIQGTKKRGFRVSSRTAGSVCEFLFRVLFGRFKGEYGLEFGKKTRSERESRLEDCITTAQIVYLDKDLATKGVFSSVMSNHELQAADRYQGD